MNDNYTEPVTVDSDTSGLAEGDGDPIAQMLQALIGGGPGDGNFGELTQQQERYESLVDRVNEIQDYLENDAPTHQFPVTFTSQELFWVNNAVGWFLSTCVLGNPAYDADDAANTLLNVADRVLSLVAEHQHDAVAV